MRRGRYAKPEPRPTPAPIVRGGRKMYTLWRYERYENGNRKDVVRIRPRRSTWLGQLGRDE